MQNYTHTLNIFSSQVIQKYKYYDEKYIKNNIDTLANLMLMLIAFLLPIITYRITDFFVALLYLLIFKQNKLELIYSAVKNPVVLSFMLYAILETSWFYLYGSEVFIPTPQLPYPLYIPKFSYIYLYPVLIIIFLQYRFVPYILSAFLAGMMFSEIVSYDIYFNLHYLDFMPYIRAEAKSIYPTAFMTHLNYGLFLSIASSIVILTFMRQRHYLVNIINTILLMSIITTQFINNARSGYILFVIAILLSTILMYKKKFFLFLPIIALFISAVIYLALTYSPNFKYEIAQTTNTIKQITEDSNYHNSIGIRVINYKESMKVISQKPIFGYGNAQHVKALSTHLKKEYPRHAGTIYRHSTTDSQYLDILIQYGLVGFLIFLNIFYQLLRYGYANNYLNNIAILLVFLFLVYGIQANFLFFFNSSSLLLVFMTSILLVKRNDNQLSWSKLWKF